VKTAKEAVNSSRRSLPSAWKGRVSKRSGSGEWPTAIKIKLKNAGYRLAYRVDDSRVVVIVVAVGKRVKG
jgi:hypothetical protein